MDSEVTVEPRAAVFVCAAALVLAACIPTSLRASTVGALTSFVNGAPADAAEVNDSFATVKAAVDDNSARLDALE